MRMPVVTACVLVASVFFTCLTYYQPIIPLSPGIDASWAFALNYFHQHQLIMGRDIVFTFGPLGFLEHVRGPDHDTAYHVAAFWFGVSVIANILIFQLCLKSMHNNLSLLLNLLIGCLLIVLLNYNIDRCFVILYASIFLHWKTRQWRYLLIAPTVATLCILIKFSYGIVALSLLLPYLYLIACKKTDIAPAATAAAALPLLYFLFWWLTCNSSDGAAEYLLAGIEFSRGSTSAMALNPENNGWAIVSFYAVFMLCAITASKADSHSLLTPYLCFLGAAFVWGKYAFGREEANHLALLMTFVLYALLVWAISSKLLTVKIIQLTGIGLCFLAWQRMHSAETGAAIFMPEPRYFSLATFKKNRWDIDERLHKWEKASNRNLQPLTLPDGMRSTIGSYTVDIYPWESLIVQANHLTWQPRPVFQNYITYTPALDEANRTFFVSERAPEFIVWHYHDMADIDLRYPLNTNPLTLQAILDNYKIEMCEAAFCLWKKSGVPQLKIAGVPSRVNANWNTWITVPDSQSDIVQAELNTERTFAGKINSIFWKEGGISIDYRLRDGSIKTHSLVVDTASAGVWASPYLERFTLPPTGKENLREDVDAIRIRTTRPWAFDAEIHVTWKATRFIAAGRPW